MCFLGFVMGDTCLVGFGLFFFVVVVWDGGFGGGFFFFYLQN